MLLSLGFHIGPDSVRALVVDVRTGVTAASESAPSIEEAYQTIVPYIDQIVGVGIATTGPLANIPPLFAKLPKRIAVAAPINDIHAHVAGVGVAAPSTLVIIMREPMRLLLNSRVRAAPPGVRIVESGFLPDYIGYKIEQPGPIDTADAARETARWCDVLRESGVPVRRFVATGAFALTSTDHMQMYCNVLDAKIKVSAAEHPAALGAAIFGAIAAGKSATGFASVSQVVHAMTPQREALVFRRDVRGGKRH